MLNIIVPEKEYWDEINECFIYKKAQKLQLEHSLVAIKKWEATWQKPFLSKNEKTEDETIDYIKCMTITQNVPSDVYDRLTKNNYRDIENYISSPMTATVINEQESKILNSETVTAELIYYWMLSLNIPPEYQKWHLNQLITLLRVTNIKNNPPKKKSPREIMERNAALNEARKQQLKTKG